MLFTIKDWPMFGRTIWILNTFILRFSWSSRLIFFVPKRTPFISNSQYQPFHDILTFTELRFPQ